MLVQTRASRLGTEATSSPITNRIPVAKIRLLHLNAGIDTAAGGKYLRVSQLCAPFSRPHPLPPACRQIYVAKENCHVRCLTARLAQYGTNLTCVTMMETQAVPSFVRFREPYAAYPTQRDLALSLYSPLSHPHLMSCLLLYQGIFQQQASLVSRQAFAQARFQRRATRQHRVRSFQARALLR